MTRRRQPIRQSQNKAAVVKPINWVAPVDGWQTAVPLEELPPTAAAQLTNWFPEAGYIRARNGSYAYATGLGGSVGTLMPYSGATNKLFAATPSAIYDVSSAGAVGAAAVSGLTNAHWSSAQFTNLGGHWMVACNGSDAPQLYNSAAGTPWVNLTATGPSSLASLNVVNVYRSRLWFLQAGTCNLWFFPTDAITGVLTQINVGDVMKFGGTLVAMATWTNETTTGVVQMLVLMSSQGEVIVYQGSDPTTTTNWSLMGTFKVGLPLGGDRCLYPVGADLAMMTVDGIIPISQAILLNPAASDQASLAKNIAPTFLSTVQSVGPTIAGWELCIYPQSRMLLVNIPDQSIGTYQFVMNVETGAWCDFVGMPSTCWNAWNSGLYFGTSGGTVMQADYGSNDNGAAIDCLSVGAWTRLSDGFAPKNTTMIVADVNIDGNAQIFMGASFDFNITTPVALSSSGVQNSQAQWGVAQWGVDVWPGAGPLRILAPAPGCGATFAPTVRALVSGQTGQASNCHLLGGAIQVQQGMSGI